MHPPSLDFHFHHPEHVEYLTLAGAASASHHAQHSPSLDSLQPLRMTSPTPTADALSSGVAASSPASPDFASSSDMDSNQLSEHRAYSTRLTTRLTSSTPAHDNSSTTSRLPMSGYSDFHSSGRPSYRPPPSGSSLFHSRRLPMPQPTFPAAVAQFTRSEWNMPPPRISSKPRLENLVHRTNVSLPPISEITQVDTTFHSDMANVDQANTRSGWNTRKRMPDPETPSPSKRQHKMEQKIRLSSDSETAKGFFSNARDFVLHNPTMIDVGQITHVPNDRPDETLRWLKEYTMHGAEFDSSERDPPPRCHPNTRESIVQRATDWINSPRREKKQLWVRGAAGVGKSAIVQTLAEALAEEKRLGGSVFISRPNGRNNPYQVFPSLAYQLAVQDMNYRAYITSLMLEDPRSLEKSMKEQVRVLFIEPFVKKRLRDGLDDLVIALDGLDECDGDPAQDDPRFRKRTSDYVQCEIVQLISDFVLRYPSVPLIWIISSRPEKHLQTVFYDEVIQLSFWEEDIPVDSDEACKDVERFLVSEFKRIQKKYPDHMPHGIWPSKKDFAAITKAALGLFIFAEVVVRFVDDPYVKNPIAQLKTVLSTISKLTPSADVNPLAVLDAIYIEILKRMPGNVVGPAREIIAYMIHLDRRKAAKSKFNMALICNALFIPKDVAVTALHHLHSVLNFSGIRDIGLTRPRFYHASFRDFLQDPSRSYEFSVQNIRSFFSAGGCLGLAISEHLRTEESLPWPGEQGFTKPIIDNISQNESDSANVGPLPLPSSFPLLSPLLHSHDFAAVASELSIDVHNLLDVEINRAPSSRDFPMPAVVPHVTLERV